MGIPKVAVAEFLKNNETNQVHQQPKKHVISRPILPSGPMKAWAIELTWLKTLSDDHVQTLEKNSQVVLTVIDMFTKFAWAKVLPNKTANVVAAAFKEIIVSNGSAPSTLRSDNGSEFIAEEFKKVCSANSIKQLFSDTYSPQQNAVIERFNKTIKMMVYKYQTQYNMPKITNSDLLKIISNYNNCKHGTTEMIPSRLHNTQHQTEVKVARGMMKHRAAELIKESQHHHPKLVVGDTVRVAKRVNGEWRRGRQLKQYAYLTQWFYELYTVANISNATRLHNSLYTLMDPNGETVQQKFLRQDLLQIDRKNLTVELDRNQFVVDKVIGGPKMVSGVKKYKVIFKGYDEEPEWIPEQDSFKTAINEYQNGKSKVNPPVSVPKKVIAKPMESVAKNTQNVATSATDYIASSRTRRTITAPKRYQ